MKRIFKTTNICGGGKILKISIIANTILLFLLVVSFCNTPFGESLLVYFGLKSPWSLVKEEPRAVRAWINCLDKLNLHADIAFYGNSITRNSNFHEYFTDKIIVNLGYGSEDIDGLRNRMGLLRTAHPDKVFLMAGINGLKDYSDDEFLVSYAALVDSVSTVVPYDHIYVQSILPISVGKEKKCGSNDLIISRNNAIRTICKSKGCTYIDVHHLFYANGHLADGYAQDGLHLEQSHYREWAELIKPYIYE